MNKLNDGLAMDNGSSDLEKEIQRLKVDNNFLKKDVLRLERSLKAQIKKIAFLSSLNEVYIRMLETKKHS